MTSTRVRQMVLDGTMRAEKHGRDLLIFPEAIEHAKLRKTKPGPAASTATDATDATNHATIPPAIEAAAPMVKPAKASKSGSKKSSKKGSNQ